MDMTGKDTARAVAIAALALFVSAYPLAAETGKAQGIFDEAIALRETEGSASEGSNALFAESARLFEERAETDWRAWYEAGNARWWAGESGRAIVDYRRYLARDPLRAEAWENLAEARRSAGTANPGREGLLAWPWYLWLAALASFLAGAAALAHSLYLLVARKGWRRAALALLVAAGIAASGSAALIAARKPLAVAVVETQGRKGDSTAYARSPATPWKKGQEFWVLERRDTWVRARVGDAVTWVPASSLFVVP